MSKPNILYKIHENENCYKLQDITRFLYAYGIDIRPLQIYEKNFPTNIVIFPSIFIDNKLIIGIDNIVNYYEKLFNINNLLSNSLNFCQNNPKFRINDKSTHKFLIKK